MAAFFGRAAGRVTRFAGAALRAGAPPFGFARFTATGFFDPRAATTFRAFRAVTLTWRCTRLTVRRTTRRTARRGFAVCSTALLADAATSQGRGASSKRCIAGHCCRLTGRVCGRACRASCGLGRLHYRACRAPECAPDCFRRLRQDGIVFDSVALCIIGHGVSLRGIVAEPCRMHGMREEQRGLRGTIV